MNNAFPTLILDAGPAAIQLAADIQAAADTRIGLYNRPSEKGQRLKAHLAHTPSLHLEGVGKARQTQHDAQVAVDSYCDDLSLIGGDWQRLILAVPADRYYEVLRQVPWATLPHLRSLILLSPSIGSGLMVQNLLQAAGQSHVGIISLSSYYADTKYQDAAQLPRLYQGLQTADLSRSPKPGDRRRRTRLDRLGAGASRYRRPALRQPAGRRALQHHQLCSSAAGAGRHHAEGDIPAADAGAIPV